ncbi:uncharacterized protein LOC116137982 isoform X1 [Pistacia vera]|uniref:uncharacterized protein LOC116137982 isoform X1 n=1 Tax=Pistacia vera TaxID=55513 RepID=UPI001263D3CF|nr:uncharacterized protein LOC116137982 isoform X1 [Pistacia vera]
MAATMALILFHFAGILVHAGVDHHLLWSDSSPGMIFTFSLGDNLVITNNTPDGFLLVSALHHINCNTSEPFSVETGSVTVIPLTDTQTRFIISEQADLCRDGLKWQVNVRDPM